MSTTEKSQSLEERDFIRKNVYQWTLFQSLGIEIFFNLEMKIYIKKIHWTKIIFFFFKF